MTVTHLLRVTLLLGSAAILAIGCDKTDTAIHTYSAPKEAVSSDAASDPTPSDGQASAQPDAQSAPPLTWTAPASWKQVPPSNSLEVAAFQIAANDPTARMTVMPLNSPAVLANLQRWAGQLKLPKPTEADIPKLTTPTQVSGEQSLLVDMTGSPKTGDPPARLLAAIVPHNDGAWIFTLKAPEPIALQERANFDAFVHSVQFHDAQSADAAAPSQATGSPPAQAPGEQPPQAAQPPRPSFKLVHWTLPDGWQEQPGSNAMRVTSFRIAADSQQGELVVSRFPFGGYGSWLDNVNRWRGQVNLSPLAADAPGDEKPTTVAGHPARLLTFVGPPQAGGTALELTVAVDLEGNDVWFFKMLGPKPLVAGQQTAFKHFLDSLKFEPETP